MSYAFDWSGEEMNSPVLNSPRPCSHGVNCTYNGQGGCAFVHPGEEGTGRRIFAARITTVNGNQIWQKATVRLVNSGKKVDFYERRRLKMSWPEWVEYKGLGPAEQRMNTPPQVTDAMLLIQKNQNQKAHKAHKQEIGNLLFVKVSESLKVGVPMLMDDGSFRENMTAGKITGMFLEAMDIPELLSLLHDEDALGQRMLEACDVLKESYDSI
jgi:hypothetical protein